MREEEEMPTATATKEEKRNRKRKKRTYDHKGLSTPPSSQAPHLSVAHKCSQVESVKRRPKLEKYLAHVKAVLKDTGSKTLFVGNLPFSVEEDDVTKFFRGAGNIVDVRLKKVGGRCKGYGYVEFATGADAEKALEKHNQRLLDRPVNLSYLSESDDGCDETSATGESQCSTVVVSGFDHSQGPIEIESSIKRHFKDCGTIIWLKSVPSDNPRRVHVTFKELHGAKKAVELHESYLDTSLLSVTTAEENPH